MVPYHIKAGALASLVALIFGLNTYLAISPYVGGGSFSKTGSQLSQVIYSIVVPSSRQSESTERVVTAEDKAVAVDAAILEAATLSLIDADRGNDKKLERNRILKTLIAQKKYDQVLAASLPAEKSVLMGKVRGSVLTPAKGSRVTLHTLNEKTLPKGGEKTRVVGVRVGNDFVVERAVDIAPYPARFTPATVVYKFTPDTTETDQSATLALLGVSNKRKIATHDMFTASVSEGQEKNIVESLLKNPNIEWAELDAQLEPQLIPNDQFYSLESHLTQVNAPAAWDITTGSASVVTAVLDTGVTPNHPDLISKLVPGWNVVNNNATYVDEGGHGTLVAGNAGASTNNSIGVASLNWLGKIMPIKVTPDGSSLASTNALASGISWAGSHGAKVINMSFRVTGSQAVATAAQSFMNTYGGIVISAAGNVGNYSSNADGPYVVEVGGLTYTNTHYGTYGPWLDLSAPVSTYSTGLTGYSGSSGTSFSSPTTAAAAALIYAARPSLTGFQVEQYLEQGAQDITDPLGRGEWDQYGHSVCSNLSCAWSATAGYDQCAYSGTVANSCTTEDASRTYPGFDIYTGWGALDARRSLELATGTGTTTPTCTRANPSITISPLSQWGNAGETKNYTVTVTNNDSGSGCTASNFAVTSTMPTGLSQNPATYTTSLSVGQSNQRVVAVTAAAGTSGMKTFTERVVHSAATQYSATATANFNIFPTVLTTGQPNVSGNVEPDQPRDTTAPSISISPTNGSTLPNSGNVAITANAADASGIFEVKIYFDNVLKKTCPFGNISPAICSYNQQMNQVSAGQHTIRAEARDGVSPANVGTATSTVTRP